jgi:hypothetical protein
LLALFIALGGSAYAAATIRSSDVVNDSLTGGDIRGRAAKAGRPFTQGTITGQDVRGSAAAPGRPAVNGSLTGADIAANSLGGNDVLEAGLGKVPNADRIDGRDVTALGAAIRTSRQPTGQCDVPNTPNECAKVTLTVPPGKQYRAVVWSTLSVVSAANVDVYYCPTIKRNTGFDLRCLTPNTLADRISLAANYTESASTQGDTSWLGVNLGPGLWTFSTMVYPGSTLVESHHMAANTTVMVTDAAAPPPPGALGGSTGTSGAGGSSTGTVIGGSSGSSGSSGTSGTSGGTGTSTGSSGSSGTSGS